MENISIYFDGCSWGCVYYLGVYKGIMKYYNKKQINNINWHVLFTILWIIMNNYLTK